MLQPGHTLQGRYTVRDHLGQGGMGSVYRAYDHRLSLDVAVKEFTPPPGLRPEELPQLREPVSYTHLDVYKRQIVICSIPASLMR